MFIDHKDRETWLRARLEGFGIGASATPSLLGMSPYRGPWAVWCAHKAPHLETPVGDHVKDGADLEAAVVSIFARREGLQLHHHEFSIYSHPRVEWLRFSPDATMGKLDAPTRHFEVKVVMSPDVAGALPPSGEMPLDAFPVPHWPYQGLHQMACLPSLTEVTIVAMLPWYELRTYRIRRTPEARSAIGVIATRVRDWRARYLVGDEMPPVDDSAHCSRWMDWAHPAPSDWHRDSKKRPTREATPAEAEAAYSYSTQRAAEKAAKTASAEARNTILGTVGDAYRLGLPCGGSVKASSHQSRRITVDDRRDTDT